MISLGLRWICYLFFQLYSVVSVQWQVALYTLGTVLTIINMISPTVFCLPVALDKLPLFSAQTLQLK